MKPQLVCDQSKKFEVKKIHVSTFQTDTYRFKLCSIPLRQISGAGCNLVIFVEPCIYMYMHVLDCLLHMYDIVLTRYVHDTDDC